MNRILLSLLALVAIATGAKADDMLSTPLTFEAVEGGTINIVNPIGLTIEYSKDGTTWTPASSNPISISVAAGDAVRFRGDNAAYAKFDMVKGELNTRFTATNDVYVYGNVMSLISSTTFATLTTLEKVGGADEWASDYNLAYLFSTPEDGSSWAPKNNTTIKNHPTKDIVLPATNVTRSGYMYMFAGCQGLTRAPELPATDLGWGCYHRMFDSCTSLEKAPVLPAATIPMQAYSNMFNGCSSLKYVKCLATDISADDCTGGWLTGVAPEGVFIKAEGMNDWTVGPQGKWNEVNGIPTGWGISSETPLTLEAAGAGTINIVNPKGLTIEWSKDGTTWTPANSNPISISVAAGDQVRLRGNNACYGVAGGNSTHITATNDVYVYGNIMSLVHKDDYAANNALTDNFAFCELFCTNDYAETANTTIKSHPTKELLLPATSLPMGVYMYMFANCQGLERAPELPAMTLSPTCYHRMFGDCTSLTAAPKLPATTLAEECYFSMFDGCTALTVAPELPATTLAGGCYSEMFAHCTALTKAPVLNALTLANNCYEGMFNGCTKLNFVKCLATNLGTKSGDVYTSTHNWLDGVSGTGTFVKAVGMEDWLVETANGIPAGWTVKDGTNFNPEATPLTLEAIAEATTVTITNPLGLFISYDKYDSTGNLLTSGSSSGTTIPIDGLDAGSYVQLSGNNAAYSDGTIANSTIITSDKDMYVYGNVMSLISSDAFATATTLTATYAFANLFNSNSHLKNHDTKDLVLPATTLTHGVYQNMFQGCTSLKTAPTLPAAKVADEAYYRMFYGCTSLNYVKCLATDITEEEALDEWLEGVAVTGTFVKAAIIDYPRGGNGIPAGWTVETETGVGTTETLTANADGKGNYWTTYYNGLASVSADATVYTAKVSNDKKQVTLTAVTGNVIPAGNAVVMKSSAEAITLTVADASGTFSDNDLLGQSASFNTPDNLYALYGDDTHDVGFYHYPTTKPGTTISTTFPAQKAYLIVPAGSRSFLSIDEGETTAIDSVEEATTADGPLYDLSGRRANGKLAPGIYVKNGKKVVIK
ncbi:MAG: leucine-rich repeat protein [Prevotella sp.]|nr:leucine-rich repeat protein [Prevotella sp.]